MRVSVLDLRQRIAAARDSAETFRLNGDIDIPLDLSGVDVGHIDARGARFHAPVNFSGARFCGIAWFDDASFEARVDFSNAVFDLDVRFDGVTFNGDALFIGAEFHGISTFDRATFRSLCALDRATCFGNLSVGETTFEQSCSLREVTCLGGLWCDRARFESLDMSGLEVHGRSFIRGSTVMRQRVRQPMLSVLRDNWSAYGDIRT